MANDSFIRLPPDSTGKRLHTRQRDVGPGTVEEQYVIPLSLRVRSGVYLSQTGAHVVQAAADTFPAARWFLINPVASGVLVAFRRCEFSSQMGSVLATPTSPRINLRLFTFTGTSSGAAITIGKVDSAFATAVAKLVSANTGLSISGGADIFSFMPTAGATAVGYAAPASLDWNPEEEGMPVLREGEGIACYQPDAGTTSDTRRYITSIAWEEYTLP
jgi:hypothetical protein